MIDTERKEDLFLDTKLIKSENKLGKLRIIDELHPVLGGQPTHEKDQPNDNNPFLDLACTMQFTIDKVNAVDKKADTKLAKAQNLKDVANVSIARDNLGLGTSATMNATSTLSDRTDQTATIKVVNDVNRAASTAQKTANNAHALAQSKQDKLTFVGDGPDVMKTGAFGIGKDATAPVDLTNSRETAFHYWGDFEPVIGDSNLKRYSTGIIISGTGANASFMSIDTNTGELYTDGKGSSKWKGLRKHYDDKNTTTDKSGFLRASGSANAVITTDLATKSKTGITRLDSSLSDAEDRAATPKAVNDVNRAASTAQKTANNAHALAQSKQDKLPFVGDGPEVMKTGAYGLGVKVSPKTFFHDAEDWNKEAGWMGFADRTSKTLPLNGYAHVANIGKRDTTNPGSSWILSYYDVLRYFIGSNKTSVEEIIWSELYTTSNTTPDKSGFLRASGSANALVESDITDKLGNSKSLVASQALVNSINSKIKPNTASKNQNGWWKCGDTGLIYQWGTTSSISASVIEVVTPVVFHSILSAHVSTKWKGVRNEGNMTSYITIENNKLFITADYTRNTDAAPRFWFAVGY